MALERKKFPTTKIARSGIAGYTAAKVGIHHLKNVSKNKLIPKQSESAKEEQQQKIAKIIFQAVSQLRGAALKAAQLLSMEIEFLPEIYRKELTKACNRVPPINRALIRKVMTTQLGKPPEKIFLSFKTTPFAAASMGQVHEATSQNGALLAVKAQYPGIASTIGSDLFLLRGIFKRIPLAHLTLPLLEEIEDRLYEEVQYRLEAKTTKWFQKNLDMERIVIPDVYEEYSTDEILTTSRLEGIHLDSWLENKPSQKEKDDYVQIMTDLFFRSFFELGAVHADPNPGNYLFRKDGTLGVLDFGCIKRLQKDFIHDIKKLIFFFLNEDKKGALELYFKWGMIKEADKKLENGFYEKALKPFCDWLIKPFQDETFDFGENSGYAGQVIKVINSTKHLFTGLNKDLVFFDRTIYGLFRIAEKLNAKIGLKRNLDMQLATLKN